MLDSTKQDIILVGGGGHCKSVIDILEGNNYFRVTGIIDLKEKVGEQILGIPIIGSDEDIPALIKEYKYFHITIGQILSNASRIRLFSTIINLGGILPVLKAHDAHVSIYSKVGAGTLIGHKAIINAGAKIGDNCIINTGAIIEHDTIVGNHCHISTMSTINADCKIGNNCFLSSHAVLNRGLEIGESSIIYSGSVVTNSFTENGIKLKGIPARIIQ